MTNLLVNKWLVSFLSSNMYKKKKHIYIILLILNVGSLPLTINIKT